MLQILFGCVVGLGIGITSIGPVAVLAIEKILKKYITQALSLVLGSSLVGGTLLFISLMGASAILDFNDILKTILALGGIGLLLFLGIKKLLKNTQKIESDKIAYAKRQRKNTSFFLGIIVILSNPGVYVTYTLLGPLIKSYDLFEHDLLTNGLISAGMIIGNMLWYIFLSNFLGKTKRTISENFTSLLNKIVGSILILIALILGIKVLELI